MTDPEQSMVERVARALADQHGDKWGYVPSDKTEWIAQRGQFGGRYRDVNERFRCDYMDEARAAIAAMREPTGEVKDAFDQWQEWASKPLDSHLTIPAELHDAVMMLTEDERKDRAIVNETVRTGRTPIRRAGMADQYGIPKATD